ncbi:MAG TPA: glycosyl hydrolase, partial [Gemmatimonadales bacterium]|nr:glycosyl hydrolase [Gemmatimonadales bacterium]
YVDRFNRRTGTAREVNPYPWFYSGEPAKEIRERWQWTFPIIFSPVDPRTLYVSSQRVWRTRDGGQTWTALSGDLTRHDPSTLEKSGGPITGDMNGPEVYATVFALGPGKRDINIIWAGSDDGLVHVTRDGGATWTNVTPREMPDFGRVSQIDASAFDNATAYVSVRRPLLNDFAPYVFKTTDFGQTWTKITNGIRADAYVHAVREDPYRRGLLYAATQHGVYISYDDGANWQALNPGFPDVPVHDLIVEKNELVIGTHGRGFWVLDNIAPLRQASPERFAAEAFLFTPPTAVRSGPGVTFSWWLKTKPQRASLELLDSAGTVLRAWEPDTATGERPAAAPGEGGGFGPGGPPQWLPVSPGLNRIHWNLRTQPFVTFPGMIMWGARINAPAVPPGRYTLRLTVDGRALTAPVVVERHPWITDVTDADLVAQYAFSRQVHAKVNEANTAVIEIRRVKGQLDDRLKRSNDGRLRSAGEALRANVSAVEESIYQVRNQSNQDPLNFPIKVNNRLATLMSMAERGDGRPTNNMPEIFGILSAELKGYTDRLLQIWSRDLVSVNAELRRLNLPPLDPKCVKLDGCPVM